MRADKNSDEEVSLELKKLLERRAKAAFYWKVFLVLSVIFALEIPLPPIPPNLSLPFTLTTLFAFGVFFFRANKLPVREALLIARLHGGRITPALLCSEMDISLDTAEEVLKLFEKKGVVELDLSAIEDKSELIYRVKGLDES